MALVVALSLPTPAFADDEINLYSARHYQTDERLYSEFTRKTGIRIRRIESGDEALLERLRSEGRNSPADVLLLVDAARLWKADQEGLFKPIRSDILESRVPTERRAPPTADGTSWFGLSSRARVIVYNRSKIDAAKISTYESLADPSLKGLLCTRSAAHPYMLSLIGALSEHLGKDATQRWAQGVVANFARTPRGGDSDQIKAIASGECGVALTNTYYLVRMMRSTQPQDRAAIERIAMVWPNQASWGTHVNVTGGGVLKTSRNPSAAQRFLEYLVSDEAQAWLAEGNNEWPIVPGVRANNTALDALGSFKADPLPVSAIGASQSTAAQVIDRVGWR
jgi:iron(III) transport system substrate-binding protein